MNNNNSRPRYITLKERLDEAFNQNNDLKRIDEYSDNSKMSKGTLKASDDIPQRYESISFSDCQKEMSICLDKMKIQLTQKMDDMSEVQNVKKDFDLLMDYFISATPSEHRAGDIKKQQINFVVVSSNFINTWK